MKPFSSLVQGFIAPGRVGSELRVAKKPPAVGIASIVLVHLAIPALGLAWVVSYALMKPSHFLLSWMYNEPYTGFGVSLPPLALIAILAGILMLLTWFLPAAILFGFNALPATRQGTRPPRAFSSVLLATMPSFAIHHAFLTLAFWLMTSGVRFFWGMRTMEDTLFSIALLVSLAWSLGSMTIAVKNVFGKHNVPSVLGIVTYVVLLVALFAVLFS